MKTVFVAGAFRGKDYWTQECNIRIAENVGMDIARLGLAPFIPHTMYRYFQGALPDHFWLAATQEFLLRSDAVYFLAGWEKSAGTLAEHMLAVDHLIPRFYDMASLRVWGLSHG